MNFLQTLASWPHGVPWGGIKRVKPVQNKVEFRKEYRPSAPPLYGAKKPQGGKPSMKHTFLWTAVAIALVAAITLGLAVYAMLQREGGASAALPQSRIESSAPPEDYQYTLGVCDDQLAVYRKGSDTPEQLFDVSVRTLPQLDQRLVAEGFRVREYAALVTLIEDYIS
jgi:hypothetical protein